MSHKKKKRKQLRCVVCNNDAYKRDMVVIYNTSPVRHACKSCIPDFKEGKRYIWNDDKTKLVEGYTQAEIRDMKEAKMTPEEKLQSRKKAREDALALMTMLYRLDYWSGMRNLGRLFAKC